MHVHDKWEWTTLTRLFGRIELPLCFLLLFALAYIVPYSFAHSPLGSGDNESLANAALVPDPAKSWAIYAELHEGGEAQYYRFDIDQGQRIHVMLFKPTDPESGSFLPGFVLMGSGLVEQGEHPDYVQEPSGAEHQVYEGKQASEATYEPFSPSAFYSLVEADLQAPMTGTYYVAVYESFRGGRYGLAIGDIESYTLNEWILIPINLLSVYQWGGQSLAVVLAPLIVVLVIGILLVIWLRSKMQKPERRQNWLGVLAGLLFVGTAMIVLMQMFLALFQTGLVSEAVVTIIFIVIPLVLGLATLRLSLRIVGEIRIRTRIYFAILGLVALFLWAGLLIGPVLAIIAALLPKRVLI